MDKNYNKWNSRRWRVNVWAMGVFTSALLASFIFPNNVPIWLGTVMPLLIAIPSVYITAETYSKKIYAEKEIEVTKESEGK